MGTVIIVGCLPRVLNLYPLVTDITIDPGSDNQKLLYCLIEENHFCLKNTSLLGLSYKQGRIKEMHMYENRWKMSQSFISKSTPGLIQGGLCIFPDLLQLFEPKSNNYALLSSAAHVVQYLSKCLNPGIDL